MINSLNGLRHYTVVSSNHKNNYISYLGASCTHCCKCFMARGIQKRY